MINQSICKERFECSPVHILAFFRNFLKNETYNTQDSAYMYDMGNINTISAKQTEILKILKRLFGIVLQKHVFEKLQTHSPTTFLSRIYIYPKEFPKLL